MYVKAILNIISTVKYVRYSTVPRLSLPPLGVRGPHCAGTFLALRWGEGRAAEAPARAAWQHPEFTLRFLAVKLRPGQQEFGARAQL